MFGVLLSRIVQTQTFKKVKFEIKKEFNRESPVIKKDCNHRLLQRFPKGLYCCISCRRTWNVRLNMEEIKLNKYQFAELISIMPESFEGSDVLCNKCLKKIQNPKMIKNICDDCNRQSSAEVDNI